MYNAQITAERIKALADKRGVTIKDLQQECGLSVNAIKTSAKSKNGLGATYLYSIAKILNCSTDYLLGKSDEINPYSFGSIQIVEAHGGTGKSTLIQNIVAQATKLKDNSMNVEVSTNTPKATVSNSSKMLVEMIESLSPSQKLSVMLYIEKLKEGEPVNV